MKEFNKEVNLVSYKIDEVNESNLSLNIYTKMMDDLTGYIKVEDDYKLKTLDMFARESYINDVKADWIDYKSQDEQVDP